MTAGRFPMRSDKTRALAVGDVDGDSDLDLALGNEGQQDRLYLNESLGASFSLSNPFLGNPVYLNLHRQVAAPLLPILGRTYEIELESRPGYASGPRTAVVAFGLALRPTPLATSYGALYLQSPLFFLPATTIPSPAGSTVVSIAVPTDPGLAGLTFFAQAAILGGGPELTSYLRDTFAK